MESGLVTPVKAPLLLSKQPQLSPLIETSPLHNATIKKPKIRTFQIDTRTCCQNSGTYAASLYRQSCLLLHRSLLILYRDPSLTALRLAIHTSIALLVGILYFDIGNDGSMIMNNFRYIFLSIMFLMFTSFSGTSLTCK